MTKIVSYWTLAEFWTLRHTLLLTCLIPSLVYESHSTLDHEICESRPVGLSVLCLVLLDYPLLFKCLSFGATSLPDRSYTFRVVERVMMRSRAAIVMSCVVVWGPAPASAEVSQPSREETDGVKITSRIELARLVDLAAQMNSVEIEYPTRTLDSISLTFRLTHELTPFELWDLCLKSLHKHGYTIIRLDGERGVYSVVKIADAAKEVLPSDSLELTGLVPGYQAVIVPLERLRVENTIARIKSMVPESEKIRIDKLDGVNAVLVRGVVERVETVVELVRRFDQESSPMGLLTIRVEHRTAVDVTAEVNAIINSLKTHNGDSLESVLVASADENLIRVYGPEGEQGRILELIREADRKQDLRTEVIDPRGYPLETVASFLESMAKDPSARGSGEAWRVVQDPLTNTLRVTGTPAELDAVHAALDRLSDIPPESQRVIRMIEVHNREASTVRDLVGQLLNAQLLGGSRSNAPAGQADGIESSRPAFDSRVGDKERGADERDPSSDLDLAVDEELNVIIATGSPRRIEQLEQLVKQLDVRQPQVQLEVILLSLSESDTKDFGVELAGVIDTGDTLFGLGSLFGLSSLSPTSSSVVPSGGGGSGLILSPGEFSAVIRAIETVNSGRSVTMPSIVVNNNQTATLNSTTTQPYLTTSITDGGTQTFTRGGSASAGTTINVSPQIAAGDQIVLDYSFTLSSFVGESSADGVEPPTQQTSLNSITTIPDGYTIALGGIESTSEGDSDTKTPFLADIPLLGELFKSQSDSTSRSRFYVFIRATVMRSPNFEYLRYISEELADEVGVDDGWPEVQPRIIR